MAFIVNLDIEFSCLLYYGLLRKKPLINKNGDRYEIYVTWQCAGDFGENGFA